jgi:hypothetical protein
MNGTVSIMAADLEDRMKNLIQGYEQLEAMSGQVTISVFSSLRFLNHVDATVQVPVDVLNMATSYRKNLSHNTEILSKKDHDDLAAQSRQLQQVRQDLQGMAYERVVIDVITRDAVLSAKRGKKNKSDPNSLATGPRYAASRLASAARDVPIPSRAKGHQKAPPVADTSLNDPIPIPSYNDRKSSANQSTPRTGPTEVPSTRTGVVSTTASSRGRGVVSTGALPAEVANLRTTPVNPPHAVKEPAIKKPTIRWSNNCIVLYSLFGSIVLSVLVCIV